MPMRVLRRARRDAPRRASPQSRIASAAARVVRAARRSSSARSSAHRSPAVSSTSCAGPAKSSGVEGVFELGTRRPDVRDRRSLRGRHPPRARWASARGCSSQALAEDLTGYRDAHPAQGAEARPDRRRPGRAQGRAHRRGRDQARRLPRRPRTSRTSRSKSRSAAEPHGASRCPSLRSAGCSCGTSRCGCWSRSPASRFAVLLILMQLGFRSALFESTVRFHERFQLRHRAVQPGQRVHRAPGAVLDPPPVRGARRARRRRPSARSTSSRPSWKNPWTNDRRSINAVGIDPTRRRARHAGLRRRAARSCAAQDVVLFDAASRPEFGAGGRALRRRTRRSSPRSTIARSRSWAWSRSARRSASTAPCSPASTTGCGCFRTGSRNQIQLGLVTLKPGVDPDAVRDRLRAYAAEGRAGA